MKHDSRNLKYGATSVIISVVLVAAIVVVNFLFSALSARYSFYTDMTGESNYTITEEVREALHAVEDEVNIIFCHDRDYIEQSSEMHDIMITAEYLADEFSWLNVKYINSVADPLAVQKYTLNQSEAVLQTHVIVESGEEYLKLNYKTFYVVDSDNTTVWGLKAEEKFASAILSVTADEKPVAYYTNTHGEEVSEKLLELVENAGYEAKPIDLTQEDIRAEARLIIINGPKYDFSSGYEYTEEENGEITVEKTADELAKIDKFLTQDNGSLMVFLDPRMDDLPELEKYLKEWGIVFDNNIVIDKTQSITQSGGAVVGEYCTDDTLASNLINEIAELETKPKTIFNKTGTISIADTFTASQ